MLLVPLLVRSVRRKHVFHMEMPFVSAVCIVCTYDLIKTVGEFSSDNGDIIASLGWNCFISGKGRINYRLPAETSLINEAIIIVAPEHQLCYSLIIHELYGRTF
jgi:hypothetical protein